MCMDKDARQCEFSERYCDITKVVSQLFLLSYPMYQIILFPRKAFLAAIEVAVERRLQSVVLSDVVHHFMFLVKAP